MNRGNKKIIGRICAESERRGEFAKKKKNYISKREGIEQDADDLDFEWFRIPL